MTYVCGDRKLHSMQVRTMSAFGQRTHFAKDGISWRLIRTTASIARYGLRSARSTRFSRTYRYDQSHFIARDLELARSWPRIIETKAPLTNEWAKVKNKFYLLIRCI